MPGYWLTNLRFIPLLDGAASDDEVKAEAAEVEAREDSHAEVEAVAVCTATSGAEVVGTVAAGAKGEIFVLFMMKEILWRWDDEEGSGTAGAPVVIV